MLEFHYQEKYVNVTFTNFYINSGKTGAGASVCQSECKSYWSYFYCQY